MLMQRIEAPLVSVEEIRMEGIALPGDSLPVPTYEIGWQADAAAPE